MVPKTSGDWSFKRKALVIHETPCGGEKKTLVACSAVDCSGLEFARRDCFVTTNLSLIVKKLLEPGGRAAIALPDATLFGDGTALLSLYLG